MKRINIAGIFIVLLTTVLLFVVGFASSKKESAKEVYQVYLNGEKIGLLQDENDLLNLIDNEQENIKQQFGVDRVYPPDGLTTKKYITYDDNLSTAEDLYNTIEDKSTFTILGYTVTIKAEDKSVKTIYILNKEDLEPALLDAAKAFVDADKLENFLNESQSEITDTGKIIESVYFEEKITIKESYLPVDAEIITNKSDLTKYLLFGTLEKQDEYVVKNGDTVSTVAFNNKLSNEELLIANPNLSSINSLLSPGQVLNIGLINPLFTVVEESIVVEDVEKAYDTIFEEDSSKYASQSYEKQKGINGVNRITENVKRKNGEITNLRATNTTEISAPVNRIYVRGTKVAPNYNYNYYPPAASGTDWGWPTTSPYVITSRYGWRWGRLHGGIDVSGSGFGSPIYSATEGTVKVINASCSDHGYYGSPCGGQLGNYVHIETSNGLLIVYAHLRNSIQVKVGQTISKGQLIGYMGNSGSSTGTHLHFEIRDENGTKVDPCRVAFKC